MKHRRRRIANIVAIGVALGVAVVGVWWREAYGRHPVASLAGLIGLVGYLLFQVFYDTQAEVALAAANLRIDGVDGRVRRLEGRVDAIEAERTPPHGTPVLIIPPEGLP